MDEPGVLCRVCEKTFPPTVEHWVLVARGAVALYHRPCLLYRHGRQVRGWVVAPPLDIRRRDMPPTK